MKSHTSLVAQQTRLSEWTDMVGTAKTVRKE